MPSLVDAMRGSPSSPGPCARDSWPGAARRYARCSSAASIAATCAADLDFELALDVLGGPLFYRLLITGGPIDDQLAQGVVELILRGFAPKPKSSRRKKETR